MSRNMILVKTVPYQVKGVNGDTDVVSHRFMGRSELEDWVCRIIAGGNVVFASRIKLVHSNHIRDISEYMMAVLCGTSPSSEFMKQVLKQAISDLEIDIQSLRMITPEQIVEAKNSFPNNIKRR